MESHVTVPTWQLKYDISSYDFGFSSYISFNFSPWSGILGGLPHSGPQIRRFFPREGEDRDQIPPEADSGIGAGFPSTRNDKIILIIMYTVHIK